MDGKASHGKLGEQHEGAVAGEFAGMSLVAS